MKKILFAIFITLLLSSCGSDTINTQSSIKNNKIEVLANIPEASGICYNNSTDSFFIVHDEGRIYEMNSKGDILRVKNIGKYDLEGIVCNPNESTIYVLIENTGNILSISTMNLEILQEYSLDLNKKDRKKYFNEKSGAEGLAINGDKIYISTQADKNNLLEFNILKKDNSLELIKVYDVKSHDLSGMTFYNNTLHIISDKNNSIYKYDLKNESITETIKLEEGNWEGIVFNTVGELFLADDSGTVIQYNLSNK